MARQRRPTQLERIAAAFADAVGAEEFERAAGWLAVARWHAGHTEVVLDPRAGQRGFAAVVCWITRPRGGQSMGSLPR